MVSIGVFMSSGMQHIFNQQKSVSESTSLSEFTNTLYNTVDLFQTGSIVDSWSGIVFQRSQYFDTGWFSYIGPITLRGQYCDDPDLTEAEQETTHLIIKNNLTFTWSNTPLWYSSHPESHTITNNAWNIIAGRWILWSEIWTSWLGVDTYLNTPTWLAQIWNHLYISDTLNNRILIFDTTTNSTSVLLNESDGIFQPTELSLSGSNSLIITNSWNWEILELSSESTNSDTLSIVFSGSNNLNDITKYQLEFLGEINNIHISWSNLVSSPSPGRYVEYSWNTLTNYFVNFVNQQSHQPWCPSNNSYILSWDTPVRCTRSWTGRTSNPRQVPFSNPSEVIQLSNINISGIDTSDSHYVKLTLFNSSDEIKLEKYAPYFIQSDNSLSTLWDNSLRVISSWWDYPIDTTWTEFSTTMFDTTNISYNPKTDIILPQPIQSFEVIENNWLLHFDLEYYSKYNCYNRDENITRRFIMKKSIQ